VWLIDSEPLVDAESVTEVVPMKTATSHKAALMRSLILTNCDFVPSYRTLTAL
jgi:hypothetical protein